MNAILRKAKNTLKEQTTLAIACQDGEVTFKEITKIAYKGLVGELNLKELVPTMSLKVIPTFDELSENEIAFITGGVDVPMDRVENAYQAAVTFFEGVFMYLEDQPGEEVLVNIPKIASGKPLTAVPGIGPKLEEILISIGIKTLEILVEADEANLAEGLKNAGVAAPQVAKVPDMIMKAKQILEDAGNE
jgi:hypothetical protein